MKKRCMGCMETYDSRLAVCPHCGHIEGTKAEEAIYMRPGSILSDRYIIGKIIGYGGFGATYIGWDGRLEQKVAIKEYLPSEFSTRMPGQTQVTVFKGEKDEQFHDGLKKFIEEARRLAKFQNEEGIVKIFDSFEENDTAYIIMEYLDGMTLTEYLNRVGTIPEDIAVNMIMPVMNSLIAVHEEGIIHRDIAPDNIFITSNNEVKLIDFGASRYATTSHSRSLSVIVKPGFSPEEQYRSRGDQGPHTDVYALGATLYKMITGETIPDAMKRRAMYEGKNKDILVSPRKFVKISRNREVAILNALNVRIEDRTPDVQAFIDELNADPPAKRRYGKIKKIDIYAWPFWLKVTVPTALAAFITVGVLLGAGVLFNNQYVVQGDKVKVPDIIGYSAEKAQKLDAFDEEKEYYLVLSKGEKFICEDDKTSGEIFRTNPRKGVYLNSHSSVVYNIFEFLEDIKKNDDGTVELPENFVGFNLEEIQSYLNEYKITNYTTETEYSDTVAQGAVIRVEKEDGTVINDGKINVAFYPDEKLVIIVSKGKGPREVSNCVGMMLEEAKTTLIDKGFENIEETAKKVYRESGHKEGEILSQTPERGEINVNDKITLVYATFEETHSVENVINKDKNEAKKILADENFKVEFSDEVYDSNVPKGHVISTEPAAGLELEEGKTVIVLISKGPEPRKIEFEYNGHGNGDNSTTKYIGRTFGQDDERNPDPLPVPTDSKNQFKFEGWYADSSFNNPVANDTMVEGFYTTLYAKWRPYSYEIVFERGSDKATGSMSKMNPECEKSIKLNSNKFTRTGYSFDCWSCSNGKKYNDGATFDDLTISKDEKVIMTAQWKANKYNVTIDPDGGNASKSSITVTYDSTYGSLPDCSKNYCNFKGWYYDGNKIESSTKFNPSNPNNVTLKASWEYKTYQISFNTDGETSCSPVSVKYNDNYKLPSSNPKKDYYNFDHWEYNGQKITTSTKFNPSNPDNVTLKAVWTQKSTSGWTLASNVPAGADIVKTSWDYREYTTSSSSSKSGWTRDDSKTKWEWSSWSDWSAWSRNNPGGNTESREVQSKDNYSTKTYYVYYHFYKADNGNHTWCPSKYHNGTLYDSIYHEIRSETPFNYKGQSTCWNAISRYSGSACPDCKKAEKDNVTEYWFPNSDYPTVTESYVSSTDYRYRTRNKIYTYSFYRDVSKSDTDPSGKSNVTNIKKYVKYIER